ncbi:hypothetical protein BOX15_Mlig000369g4, partial [Macrostomum lignano]
QWQRHAAEQLRRRQQQLEAKLAADAERLQRQRDEANRLRAEKAAQAEARRRRVLETAQRLQRERLQRLKSGAAAAHAVQPPQTQTKKINLKTPRTAKHRQVCCEQSTAVKAVFSAASPQQMQKLEQIVELRKPLLDSCGSLALQSSNQLQPESQPPPPPTPLPPQLDLSISDVTIEFEQDENHHPSQLQQQQQQQIEDQASKAEDAKPPEAEPDEDLSDYEDEEDEPDFSRPEFADDALADWVTEDNLHWMFSRQAVEGLRWWHVFRPVDAGSKLADSLFRAFEDVATKSDSTDDVNDEDSINNNDDDGHSRRRRRCWLSRRGSSALWDTPPSEVVRRQIQDDR